MSTRGFTLLEVLVSTLIMGVAVVGLISAISGSVGNVSRLTDYDRAALLAQQKMEELLLEPSPPPEGRFDPAATGGVEAGWRARLSLFEAPPEARPGTTVLERLELEVWWTAAGRERKLSLEGFRRAVLRGPQ